MATDDLAAEVAAHRLHGCEKCGADPMCAKCLTGWPCLVRRLADELEQATEQLHAHQSTGDYQAGWDNGARAMEAGLATTRAALAAAKAERDRLRARVAALGETDG